MYKDHVTLHYYYAFRKIGQWQHRATPYFVTGLPAWAGVHLFNMDYNYDCVRTRRRSKASLPPHILVLCRSTSLYPSSMTSFIVLWIVHVVPRYTHVLLYRLFLFLNFQVSHCEQLPDYPRNLSVTQATQLPNPTLIQSHYMGFISILYGV